ncbi:MAG: thiamine diphosphokinase [Fimbriimonadaceae bacterium]
MPEKVLGVLAGLDFFPDQMTRWMEDADVIYAADSGADTVLKAGYRPILVGDLDSFQSRDRMAELRVIEDLDQNRNDCDKMLAVAKQDGVRRIYLVGVEGDLVDHQWATYSAAIKSGLEVYFVYRRGLARLMRPGERAEMPSKPEQRCALLPLTACRTVTFHGVRWPLDNAELRLDGLISSSNLSEAHIVNASLEEGHALLFTENDGSPAW